METKRFTKEQIEKISMELYTQLSGGTDIYQKGCISLLEAALSCMHYYNNEKDNTRLFLVMKIISKELADSRMLKSGVTDQTLDYLKPFYDCSEEMRSKSWSHLQNCYRTQGADEIFQSVLNSYISS